ncbi:CRISPR-associated protein Csm3 [Thermosyntropha lipolytica DSM 11003]|uniref:CRISPR system Cms endoribonuclease Csm3 n=1 Tax=Thermosyntropha lipolytica DSM 11003 TaxID=1123382 RepID=A0A1M5RLY5_9FIRM|nr:type III-A CRISPR-associated RAMP protein Csm3 [Thermosyntropha lipolytica]SHH26873.1 CRISPR-associated protein Csm3 [Thermosyntropha lipolytica DSM 11003]
MMSYMQKMAGKIKITADLCLLSGLHIGGAKEFSSIGAVDSIVIRDPLTKEPIIPGSSVKGKMRNLLARYMPGGPYIEIEDEPEVLKRLFGSSSGKGDKRRIVAARLQFPDIFMKRSSVEKIKNMETDLYLTEIKFENTISRLLGVATPRQIERVPAGAEFDFTLLYNIENEEDIEKDFENIALGLKLLQYDYLGGGGTRGNGRIALKEFQITPIAWEGSGKIADLQKKLDEAAVLRSAV